MTKKIFHSILLVACTVLLACYLVILTSLNDYFTSLRKSQLKTQLSFASTAVEDEGIEYLKNLENGEYRLTLIDTDGTVLYDTNADAATMENHSDRREFQRLSSPATESPTAIPAPDGTDLLFCQEALR